ncbi:Uncharacterized protein PBTT_09846 [Plasmodiophora brassicae]|uniref:Uncharacterized protein n=1 Tax=Plasmodiophora brassicae TaxID=37360 RepID=A0A0G4J234_PLABS|nr:hypothetical protein PBRA_001967 [Plasmodiophora brassicae]
MSLKHSVIFQGFVGMCIGTGFGLWWKMRQWEAIKTSRTYYQNLQKKLVENGDLPADFFHKH